MRTKIVCLLCLWTSVFAGPPHFGENFKQLLHSIEEIGEELQQETSIDELSALMNDWNDFKTTYEKTYENEKEELRRMKIFAHNRKQIAAHNELYKKGLATYYMDINQFADITEAEFVKRMTTNNKGDDDDYDEDPNGDGDIDGRFPWNILPPYVDWREKGAVTPIRDQGLCLSGWAFAATSALESHYFIKYSHLIPLSVQNLIDCSNGPYKNQGCEGGLPSNAFKYVYENNGIDTEAAYPYEAKLDRCRYRCSQRAKVKVKSFVSLADREQTLMKSLAEVGPFTATVSLDPDMSFYRGGVFCDTKKNTTSQSVLVVGYGTDDQTGANYWLIKNSWSTCWGMDGYFQLCRSKKNLKQPIYPNV